MLWGDDYASTVACVCIDRVERTPAIRQKLIDLGFDPVAGSAAGFATIVDRDLPVWREVVRSSGIKAE
jgi:hypothetical protein